MNIVDRLDKITAPTLIINNEHDDFSPREEAEFLASHINGTKLEDVKDSGHMSSMEQPERVTELIRNFIEA